MSYCQLPILKRALREKCPNTEFFCSVFSRIWSEYGYSVRKWENTDQKKLRIWTIFTQWKALTFAKELNVENFKVSDDWLPGRRERNHTTFKAASGESKSETPGMVDGWWETSLPTLLSNYELKDIYITMTNFDYSINAF